MATDPAQALAPADPIAAAAAAFRSEREPEPAPQARAPDGKFAPAEPVLTEPQAEIEAIEPEADAAADPVTEIDPDTVDGGDAPEEGQLPPVDMPVSWSKEDAELWTSLPPEAQAKIAEREGQREAAVNSKFQEAANARKAIEGRLVEANTNRDSYAKAIDVVLGLVTPTKPDPHAYGLGTEHYNREAFDLANYQYDQAMETIGGLVQQREAISAQQESEAGEKARAAFQAIEEVGRPLLMAAVPDLADAAKAPTIIGDVIKYAITQGIPESAFAPENQGNITSGEILMAWKAMQFDKLQAAKGRVAPKAQPKPAAPPMRPGVAKGPTAEKNVQFGKDMARLAKSGSVEDGAAIWKHFR